MAIYACLWPNKDVSFVWAANREEAAEILDEAGDPGPVQFKCLGHFLLNLKFKGMLPPTEGGPEAAAFALESFGEETIAEMARRTGLWPSVAIPDNEGASPVSLRKQMKLEVRLAVAILRALQADAEMRGGDASIDTVTLEAVFAAAAGVIQQYDAADGSTFSHASDLASEIEDGELAVPECPRVPADDEDESDGQ